MVGGGVGVDGDGEGGLGSNLGGEGGLADLSEGDAVDVREGAEVDRARGFVFEDEGGVAVGEGDASYCADGLDVGGGACGEVFDGEAGDVAGEGCGA